MSKELTDAWKDGNLGKGYFYVRITNGNILVDNIDYDRPHYAGFYHEVSDIIAPVPDYDHFVDLTEKVKELEQDNKTLINNYKLLEDKQASDIIHGQALVDEFGDFEGLYEELQNLRSLLKECRKHFQVAAYNPETGAVYNNIVNLLNRINASIGESEE